MKNRLKKLEIYVLAMAVIAAALLVTIGWPLCSKACEGEGYDDGYREGMHHTISQHVTYCAVLLSRLAPEKTTRSYVRVTSKKYEARMSTCLAIAGEAEYHEVDVIFSLAIAWEESKFKEVIESHAGAVGPLQVLPKYWCPNGKRKGCDLVEAGILAMKKLLAKYPEAEAACHYNGGNICGRGAKAYAKRVLITKERLNAFRLWRSE